MPGSVPKGQPSTVDGRLRYKMFATQFPNLQWLKEQAENRFYRKHVSSTNATSGWPTVVLNVRASDTYRDNIPGPLSLFSNWTGRSRVAVENRAFDIPTECFLITNEQQRYTLEIHGHAETFNVHFGEEWTRNATSALIRDHSFLLDNGDEGGNTFQFYNKLYQKSQEVTNLLRQLQALAGGNVLRRDELLLEIIAQLIRENNSSTIGMNRLRAGKLSTKKEILRRLHFATDYIYSSASDALTLEALAKVSMISKFHLLRAFKEVYNQTPHQFITNIKIAKAKTLLKNTKMEVSQIGATLGFDTSSTFSRRFRQVTGLYPTQYRLEN